MPGLVPGIHVFVSTRRKDVDGRDKPGHDGAEESVHSYAIALPPAGRGRIASVMQSGRGVQVSTLGVLAERKPFTPTPTRFRNIRRVALICPTRQVALSNAGRRRLLCMGLFSIFS
ncbi:hypothetical protein DXU07_10825 [Bradyrhizobium elkanii]